MSVFGIVVALVFLGLFTLWCCLPPHDDFESYVLGMEEDEEP